MRKNLRLWFYITGLLSTTVGIGFLGHEWIHHIGIGVGGFLTGAGVALMLSRLGGYTDGP